MNRKIVPCSAMAAALIWAASLSAPNAAAQPQSPPPGGPEAGAQTGGRPPSWPRRGPDFKKRLGLTDDQAGKLQAAFKAQRAAMKPLMDQRRDAMKTLRRQVRSNAADSDIQATLSSLDHARQSIQAARSKFQMTTLSSILTPTQRAKMLLLRMQKMRRMRGHWQGRRPGRGGYGRGGMGGPGGPGGGN